MKKKSKHVVWWESLTIREKDRLQYKLDTERNYNHFRDSEIKELYEKEKV